jgi:hypothetical protein
VQRGWSSFKAVLAEDAADYEPETPLVTTVTAFDAPEKSVLFRLGADTIYQCLHQMETMYPK